jgi:CheY-like chemotaxis protein
MTAVSNKHVLLVEDDPELREALAQVLSDEGYRLSGVRNGLEAIRSLRDGDRPGVILLDLSMPVVNGWEFRIHQKRTPSMADIPVVVITAGHYSRDEIAWLEPADFLQKPIDLQRLLDTVRRYCGEPQASSRSG